MTAILFIAVLAVLVFVHELGHFSVAKKLGVLVHEFALGFPPRIFSKKIGETKYSINIIPFGGYVKIEGEDSPKDSEGAPLETGKIDLQKRSLYFRPAWQKVAVLLAGVSANIVFAWLLLSISMMSGMTSSIDQNETQYASNVRVMVVSVSPDSPAALAELTPGTSILSAADSEKSLGAGISSAEALQEFVKNSNGKEIFLRTSDTKGEHVVSLIPKKGIIIGSEYGIGISMDFVGDLKFPIYRAFYEGGKLTIHMLVGITEGLWTLVAGIFSGHANLSQVSGPVGIAGLVSEARTLGLAYFLSFVAFISLNLAVLNLVPFPALDGGRILFVIIESIKRSPISPKVANITNTIGFGLLMLLMIVVTVRDILKLF